MSHSRCMLTLDHNGARWAVIVAQSEGRTDAGAEPVHELQRAVSRLWPSMQVNWASLGSNESASPGPVDVEVLDGLPADGRNETVCRRTAAKAAQVRDEGRVVGRIVAEPAQRGRCCDRREDAVDALMEAWRLRTRSPHHGAVRRDRCDQCGKYVDPLADALFWRPGSPHRFGERCMLTLDRSGVRWTVIVAESKGDWPSDLLGDLRIAVDRLWPTLHVDWEGLGPRSGGWPGERPADTDVVDGGRVAGGRIVGGHVVGRVAVGSL